MAKNLKPKAGKGEHTDPKDMSPEELRAEIRKAADELLALESELLPPKATIAQAKAAMKPINAKIRRVRARINGFGVDLEDFDPLFGVYRLETEAKKKESLHNIRVVFDALELGEQGSLMPGMDGDGAAPKPIGKSPTPGYTAETGRTAFREGKPLSANPAAPGRGDHDAWKAGWLEAEAAEAAATATKVNPDAAATA